MCDEGRGGPAGGSPASRDTRHRRRAEPVDLALIGLLAMGGLALLITLAGLRRDLRLIAAAPRGDTIDLAGSRVGKLVITHGAG